MPAPRLLLVTDAQRSRLPLPELAEAAVQGGVDAIYLRDVQLEGDTLREFVAALRQRIGNDVQLTLPGEAAAEAAGTGLHLRERDPLPRVPFCPLGRSVHSVAEAARPLGADYLLAGHCYPTTSKPGRLPLGMAQFAAIAGKAPCPVLAIGGITPERVAEVVAAGAHGVAVIGAIASAANPYAAAQELRHALDEAIHRVQEQSMIEQSVTIEITVNGKQILVPAAATIHDFLASRKMTDAMAIVEQNGEIIARARYAATPLSPGDRLEVVHAVGGG